MVRQMRTIVRIMRTSRTEPARKTGRGRATTPEPFITPAVSQMGVVPAPPAGASVRRKNPPKRMRQHDCQKYGIP